MLYLTFDDGPSPRVTEWVLDQLKAYEAQATFFVLGKNVKAHADIVHNIIDAGHAIGNHGYAHPNGWKTPFHAYLKDFLKGQQAIREYTGYHTELFRPPYGRITHKQALHIKRTHQIVMMDVMAGDFDPKLTPGQATQNVLSHAKGGSIVCLHDSEKAWPRLREALPRILEHYTAEDFQFAPLNPIPSQAAVAH